MRRLQVFLLPILFGLAGAAYAGGPHGVDVGWTVDHISGQILFTSTSASKLVQAETGWIRVEMGLVNGHTTWDSTMFSYYDTVVNNARNAGLQILMLVDSGSWPGGQSEWCANNSENNAGTNGDNVYMEGFATNAVMPIVQHFHDRVKYFELWNEPNCWTTNPSSGVYTGATFVYPSNYGWLLTRSWEAVHIAHQINDVTLFSGGLFGLNSYGANYSAAGGQYLDDTYSTGTNVTKGGSFAHTKSNYGAYPLDGIGQHIYITIGGLVSSNSFRQYEDWVHSALTKYEGASSPKKTFITEFGWQTTNSSNANGVSAAVQDTNLVTAFSTIAATPYVQTAIWFQWADNLAGGLWYGVVDSSGNPKLSYPDYERAEHFEGIYATGATNSGMLTYFNSLGQAVLGSPFDNGHGPWVYAFLNGNAQDCDGGSHLNLTLMSSTNGTFEVNDLHGFWSFYTTNNGAVNYGYATTNAYTSGSGTRQDFSRGYLTWDSINQVVWHAGNLVPPPPTGLLATALNGEVDLQWNTVATATSYNVKRSTTNGGLYSILTGVVGSPVFADGGVNNNTTYYYVVSALNSYGESDNSAQVNATPDANMGTLPSPWQDADIGNVGLTGGAGYSGGKFSVKGSGADIGSTNDAFNFTSQPFSGNGALIARVKTQQNTDPWAKAAVMFRETLATNSTYALALLTPTNGSHFQARTATAGGSIDVAGPVVTAPWWVRILRNGSNFTASVSSDGVNFVQVGATNITMATNVFVGFAVSSHTTNALSTATFDNVSIPTPPPAPAGLTASSGAAQISLAWLATTGAGGYNVKRGLAGSGPFTNVANGLTLTNYVDPGLINGTTYYYVVSATNIGGEGPISALASAVPGLPAQPTGLVATAFNGEVDLQWTTVATATSYNVKRATTNTGSYSTLTSVVGSPVFADGSVANNTTYYYVISAVNSYGESSNSAPANATPDSSMSYLPSPWQQADIGSVNLTGGAGYSGGKFTAKGSGADIGSTNDAFNFTSQPWTGDGAIVARVKTQQNTDPWAKAGVMFRETLASNSTCALALLTPANGSHLQARTVTGGGTADVAGPVVAAPYWLKLVRGGSTFSASTSSNGVNYVLLGATNITMASNVFVGFAVSSHTTNALSTATFDNVAVTAPPTITTQPQPQTAQLSSNVTLTVAASSTSTPGYQWYFGASTVAGATGTALTLTNVGFAQAGSYSVVVSNIAGNATGGPAALTVVDTIPPTITACAPNRTLAAGITCQAVLPDLTGQVVASDASGTVTVIQNPPPGTVLAMGMTNITFTARDSSGNASFCAATVTVADLTPPLIAFCATNVTLAATTTCQAILPDLTSATYILAIDNCSSVTVTQMPPAGTVLSLGTTNLVTLTAFDSAGNATNCAVAVAVPGAPTITLQPADVTVALGSSATFSVAACGAGQLLYQWEHNGTNISGATANKLCLASAQPADAGNYTVLVSNTDGSVTSSNAVLSVRALLAIDPNGVVSWSGPSTLQSATNVAGPYIDVPGATSPYTNASVRLPSQFFRLRN